MKNLLLIAFLFGPARLVAQPGAATTPFPRTITVTGSAETSVTPDEIYIGITLKEYTPKGERKKELGALTADFLADCKSLGIPDSAITVVSLQGNNQRWYWQRRSKASPDLQGEISYEVNVSRFDKVEALAEKLDDFGTTFWVARTAYSAESALRKQLKIEAVKAGREKAVYLAEAIGEHVGPAVTITEPEADNEAGNRFQTSQSVLSNRLAYKSIDETDAPSGGITSKKIRYRYEVSVVFALK